MHRPPLLCITLLLALASGCGQQAEPGIPDGGTVSEDAARSCTPCGRECCDEGTECNRFTRTCELPCQRDCHGRSCGPDTCGGECGFCGPGTRCNAYGGCDSCAANCIGRECGADGCGASCGFCNAGLSCNAAGRCIPSSGADASMPLDASVRPDAGPAGRDAGPAGRDAGPAGADAGLAGPDAGGPGVVYSVLFDNTKSQQAGQADWVIDNVGRFPSPAPTLETDWCGGISSWGFELQRTGRFTVESLWRGERITFGDWSNPQDLSNFDVYVVPEPNTAYTLAESAAIVAFVRAGGGLFVGGNHGGADRNMDGVDPPGVWNGLADAQGNPFGISFAGDSLWEAPNSNLANLPGNSVLQGPFGAVRGTTYYAGSTMILDPVANPTVRGLIWKNGAGQGTTSVTFAIARLGLGRVAAIGDSSPLDDGTSCVLESLQDGWNDPLGSNRALMLNATAWLAGMTP